MEPTFKIRHYPPSLFSPFLSPLFLPSVSRVLSFLCLSSLFLPSVSLPSFFPLSLALFFLFFLLSFCRLLSFLFLFIFSPFFLLCSSIPFSHFPLLHFTPSPLSPLFLFTSLPLSPSPSLYHPPPPPPPPPRLLHLKEPSSNEGLHAVAGLQDMSRCPT